MQRSKAGGRRTRSRIENVISTSRHRLRLRMSAYLIEIITPPYLPIMIAASTIMSCLVFQELLSALLRSFFATDRFGHLLANYVES